MMTFKNSFRNTGLTITMCLSLCLGSCDKDDSPQDNNSIKRYNVESGIIHYTTTTSGGVAGGTVTGSGTVELYFENWGARELETETGTTTTTVKIPGGPTITDTDHIHQTYKIDNETIYTVDYDKEIVYTKKDPLIEFMRQNSYDALEAGKKMLISMGSKQLANEKYKGYDCEVWTALGSKQWIYKGVTLKISTTSAGITIIEEAKEIRFDVVVPEGEFQLPNYQHQAMPGS